MAEMGTLIDLESAAAKTNLKGKHLISIDDLTKEEIEALFKLAELLEPFTKGGLNIMAVSKAGSVG
ncbi:MAG: hypothetical protein M1136_09420, partial [Chloroflexi bacterium]|nr:hypothetical protein [Chloroflexota bacterium]